MTPRMFSFNSPHGACTACDGLGIKLDVDPDLVVPDPSLSLREGAIHPWAHRNSFYFFQMLDAVSTHYGFRITTPFKDLAPEHQRILLYGSGEDEIPFFFEREGRRHVYRRPFEGSSRTWSGATGRRSRDRSGRRLKPTWVRTRAPRATAEG